MDTPEVYTLCEECDHFVGTNEAYIASAIERRTVAGIAQYTHLDSGEKEHDHDAFPSDLVASLRVWMAIRPDLFVVYRDAIGPNSEFHHPPKRRLGLDEREARLMRIAAVYPDAAEEARDSGSD